MIKKLGNGYTAKILDYYFEIIKENEVFLHENAEETYQEILKFLNDVIDYMVQEAKKKEARDNYVENPMPFFLYHILMPQSYAILSDLLVGNLPACFMELRLILEAMAKCYLASTCCPDESFFEIKLESLESVSDELKISISKLLKIFGDKIGLKDEPIALWGKLSGHWVHPYGIIKRVVNEIVEKLDIPSWALVIPLSYTESDLDVINELGECVSRLRKLLRATMNSYNSYREE